jgi:CO/xanthine dehydrogenase Mo-binding subunit
MRLTREACALVRGIGELVIVGAAAAIACVMYRLPGSASETC